MSEPLFPPIEAIIDIHTELLAEHGGASGLRDRGGLEASLARGRQMLAYSEESTICDLAAAICVSLCRNHPFVDGNKRAAFAALGITLGLNGLALDVSEREAIRVMLAVAAGKMDEATFRAWVTKNSIPDEPSSR